VARGEGADIGAGGAGRVRRGAGLNMPPRVLGETRWSDIRGAAEIGAVGPATDSRQGSQWARSQKGSGVEGLDAECLKRPRKCCSQ
jgi:hypothetical protein